MAQDQKKTGDEKSPPPYFLAKLASHTGLTHDSLAGFHRSFTHALSSRPPENRNQLMDGKLDVVQFKQALHEVLGDAQSKIGESASKDESLFRAVDRDGDGKVDFTDFVYAVKAADADLLLDKLAWVLKLYYEEAGVDTISGQKIEKMVRELGETITYRISSVEDVTGQAMAVLRSVAGVRRKDPQQNYSIPLLVAFLQASSKV